MVSTIERAIVIAPEAHAGQVDRAGSVNKEWSEARSSARSARFVARRPGAGRRRARPAAGGRTPTNQGV